MMPIHNMSVVAYECSEISASIHPLFTLRFSYHRYSHSKRLANIHTRLGWFKFADGILLVGDHRDLIVFRGTILLWNASPSENLSLFWIDIR